MQVTDKVLPWDTIVTMVRGGDLKFGRTKPVMDSYMRHKKDVKNEWRDMNSYCKHKMLGYPCATEVLSVEDDQGVEQTRQLKFVKDDSDCPGDRIAIRDNEFPYAFCPDVLHKVIWSADDLTVDEYEKHVKKHFSQGKYDIVTFVNPTHQKSIEGVHHGHALLRMRTRPHVKPMGRISCHPQHNILPDLRVAA